MSLVKGMFFDLDGTLCDTAEANFTAYSQALGAEGYAITRQDFDTTNGLRADVFIPMLAPGISQKSMLNVMEAKQKFYAEAVHLVRPNQKLIQFLEIMKGHHVMALVTTARRRNAENILKHSKIDKLFDHLIFGDEIGEAKPHPEAYLKALSLTGLRANQVVAFEDSEPGIEAASAAGIQVIRVVIDAV